MNPFRLLSRKWLISTILVLAASLVMARLGIWQLDRLEKRRSFNNRVLGQVNQPPLELNGQMLSNGDFNSEKLRDFEYRQVVVTGEYDFTHQVALRNQVWQNEYGVHLLTPLRILEADQVIFVDRGWIPGEAFYEGMEVGEWRKFNEAGVVVVQGVIRRQQTQPDFGRINDPTPAPGGERLVAWNLVNLSHIQKQIPYPILTVYIQQAPDPAWDRLPYRSQPELDLTEGPHLGYAIQWFTFAGILWIGYPFFISREDERAFKVSVS